MVGRTAFCGVVRSELRCLRANFRKYVHRACFVKLEFAGEAFPGAETQILAAIAIHSISNMGKRPIIYIAASRHDARFTRVCVASVRHFYPEAMVLLLAGGELDQRMVNEMRRFWGVEVKSLPKGDYGWGFVKLEPLFEDTSDAFLVLDSDTVLTGEVFGIWDEAEGAPFMVDLEEQSQDDVERLYYRPVQVGEQAVDLGTPEFVFNSGQWFGTPGMLKREDFTPWLEWDFPRKLKFPEAFKNGEQGILNYVLNQKAAEGSIKVARIPLMRWPGHGLEGFSDRTVATGSAPARVIHWAGMKRLRFSAMKGSDLLGYFEKLYYARIPGGEWRRHTRAFASVLHELIHRTRTRVRLFWKHKVRCFGA